MPLESIHSGELLNKYSDKEKDVAFELEKIAKAGINPTDELKTLKTIYKLKNKEGIETNRLKTLIKELVSDEYGDQLCSLADIVSLVSLCESDLNACESIEDNLGLTDKERIKTIKKYIKELKNEFLKEPYAEKNKN